MQGRTSRSLRKLFSAHKSSVCLRIASQEREAWLNWDLLVKLEEKHRQWKKGQVLWEEYKEAARLCRVGIRKAKVQLELSLAKDAKKNKKGFYRYLNQKRKVREGVPPW